MERILFGDNQFFAVNHISDEKSMAQSIRFKEDKAILRTLDIARESGSGTFMCTTHERIGGICDKFRADPTRYGDYQVYPCMPYAHKYANSVTELGITGAVKKYAPGNILGSMFKGGMAFLSRDYLAIMELLIDSEMKMFRGIRTPVIFLQNVVTDLLLGLQAREALVAFHDHIRSKYNAEAGFITMNFPRLLETLESSGIHRPIICTSINKVGFRMSGGKEGYERLLNEKRCRVIAMQVLAGGAVPPKEALEYVCALPGVESILFGASSRQNIEETVSLIRQFDAQFRKVPANAGW